MQLLSDHRRKDAVELGAASRLHKLNLQPQRAGGNLRLCFLSRAAATRAASVTAA